MPSQKAISSCIRKPITQAMKFVLLNIREQASWRTCCYDLWFQASRAAMAGAELIIKLTLTPTQDREIETVMVRATAAQQQCYYVDVNSVGEQGCGQSLLAILKVTFCMLQIIKKISLPSKLILILSEIPEKWHHGIRSKFKKLSG